MSKNKPLTGVTYTGHSLDKQIFRHLEALRMRHGLKPDKVNVLDWGCGRGRDVLWLKEKGYNVFGVDPDPVPVQNGQELFREKGFDEDALRLLPPDGITDFPDNFFHMIFSDQVFEHIDNLECVAREIARITLENGIGFHVFPPHKHIRERHLHMPFIHWLPKTGIRRALISFFLATGIDPQWKELESSDKETKTETYYRYSISKTFYRSPSLIKEVFTSHGFTATFETVNNPKIRKHKALGIFASAPVTRPLLAFLLNTFIRSELRLVKTVPAAPVNQSHQVSAQPENL